MRKNCLLREMVTEILEFYNVKRLHCVKNGEKVWVKVKFSRYRSGVAQRVGRGIALVFHDSGTRRGEWSAARPGRTLPPGNNRYPFYRRLGGPQGRSAWAENLVPTGIRFRTVQPVVSRYTDWATRPTKKCGYWAKSGRQFENCIFGRSLTCSNRLHWWLGKNNSCTHLGRSLIFALKRNFLSPRKHLKTVPSNSLICIT